MDNSDFEKLFSEYGTVVKNTWHQTYKGNNQCNGKRCLVVQLKSGSIIPRQLDIRHEETNVRGRIKVFYKGQPYGCNQCNTVHEGQCPKRMAEKERQEEQKLDRELKNKTIIISDSNLRKADENKLNADIICVPGGSWVI